MKARLTYSAEDVRELLFADAKTRLASLIAGGAELTVGRYSVLGEILRRGRVSESS